MAEKLTKQQQMAVEDRGGKLLVSAAAGSGKTKVLVDRLLGYLTDPVKPAQLDEFLIITYTKAAASELRGKIAAKLSERIAAAPGNRHLQQQMQRLYLTKISTVHAFCTDLLREHAYRLDIPGDFRVADENECVQLQLTALESVLDKAYENVGEDPDFRAFVDSQGLGRDDRQVPQILLKVYNSARCHLDPDAWLEQCVATSQLDGVTDAGQTVWGAYLLEQMRHYVQLHMDALTECVSRADNMPGMEKPAALLRATLAQLQQLRDSKSWDDVLQGKQIDYGRLTFSKDTRDTDLAEQIKATRDACKKSLEKKLRAFSDTSEQILHDLENISSALKGLVTLTKAFSETYRQLKCRRRVLDFGDLEHRTLDLLLGKKRSGPTALASEIGDGFREIMVDEYQDSNAVQDAIFTALTAKKQNCFMVGDVKQSIYQFRLADPGIFLEKYNTYAPAETAQPGEGRRILLSSNFRSGGGVISAVNAVFTACMSAEVGGLAYTEAEQLNEGVPHIPMPEPEASFYVIPVQEDTYREEAVFTAQKIASLLDGTHMVRQGDALRPITPGDIVILLRSPGSVGAEFRFALEELGINCTSGAGEDLLRTEEISALRSLLEIISNPLQDIPLIAALSGKIFGFTADDLAAIRTKQKRRSMYEALCASTLPKAQAFLKVLEQLRTEAQLRNLPQLLEYCFMLTGTDSVFAAMEDGARRQENLHAFCQIAATFETNTHGDLRQFLEYLNAMEEKGLPGTEVQSNSNAVTIMSIHKSKGLEFPVVFLCGLSREFNRESARAQVLCDQKLGLGLACVDSRNRVRYPSVAKRAIAEKMIADSVSEEMRVLYVAMTRARDRLIMTYAAKNPEKDIHELAMRMNISHRQLLTADVDCPGLWVLQTALGRIEAGELFALGGRPETVSRCEPCWEIAVAQPQSVDGLPVNKQAQTSCMPADSFTKMHTSLHKRYPHMQATQIPSKQTATQLKGRPKDLEAAEGAQVPKSTHRQWRKASFAKNNTSSVARGTAVHAVMQRIRFSACADAASVEREIDRLRDEKLISAEQASLVDANWIASFFETELGRKIVASETLLREFKFSILVPVQTSEGTEEVLLQGVVDCAMIEQDGITVLDFKTDHVTDETLPEVAANYHPQIKAYADALGRIYQKKIKAAYLYFFRINRFVKVQ